MSRPKILIVGAFPEDGSPIVGGVRRNCELLLGSSLASTHDLILVDTTQRANPVPPLYKRAVYALGRWPDFLRKLLTHRPAHALYFPSSGLSLVEKSLMAFVGRCFGTKAVVFPMAGQIMLGVDSSWALRLYYKTMFAPASTIFCQGETWVTFFRDTLHLRNEKLAIINSWTATPDLLAIGAARRFDAKEWTTIVWLTWLEPYKGILEVVRAFARFARTHPVKLEIFGGGTSEADVAAIIAAEGLEDRVTMHGWLPRDEVGNVLARSDIFTLASWFEGMPNAVIEAMATKVAVVATAVGMIPEYITAGESGLLVPPKNVEALAQALERMVTDREFRARCAESAYTVAEKRLSIENAVGQMRATFGPGVPR